MDKTGRWLVARVNPLLILIIMIAGMVFFGVTADEFEDALVPMIVIFVAGIAVMVWLAITASKVQKEVEAEEKALKEAIAKVSSLTSRSGKGNIVSVKAADPILAKAFNIVDYMNQTISYEPEVLHIGAVTVGGVTTGGTYTTGGYHYVSDRQKSGKHRLIYDKHSVNLIELTPALFRKAKNSSIAGYLADGRYIRIIRPLDTSSMSEIEQKLMIEEMKRTKYIGNHPELFLTREELTEIVNWLSDPANNE